MFAYCNNNPVINCDPTGESALVTLLFAVAGATTNVITSYIGARITGQSYSFTDGLVAAASGALCAFGSAGALAAGLVSGIYSAFMSYQNGAEWQGVILTGLVSSVFTTAGVGNLAGLEQSLANLGTQVLVDLVFCTSYNSMSAAVFKAVTMDNASQKLIPDNTVDPLPHSGRHVPMQAGQSGVNRYGGSLPGGMFTQCCY